MTVTVEIPDKFAQQMHLDGPQAHRHALERLAVEGYRSGELSRGQISELLGLSLWDTEALLKKHQCGLGLGVEEYEAGAEKLRKFVGR